MNEPPKRQACQAPPCDEPANKCRDKVSNLFPLVKNKLMY